MKKILAILLSAGLTVLATAPSLAGPAPLRHLVYKFTVGIQFSSTVHDSGFDGGGGGGGAGVSDNRASSADEGEIVVDVTGVSADGGVVVSVSENAKNARSSQPATCVVYGSNLAIICDPNGKVNDEEFAIVRFIGKNFVAPTAAASGSHWQVSDDLPGGTETNSFTVTGANAGMLTINEDRVQKIAGSHPFDQTINGTIGYNLNYTVPTSVHEMGIKRQNEGAQDYVTTRTFTDLSLVTDSMGSKQ